MSNPSNDYLSKILKERAIFIEFLIIVILLGIGLKILSHGIIKYFEISPLNCILFGILITIFALLFVLRRFLSSRILKKRMTGVVFYNPKKKKLLNTFDYNFCSSFYYYFEALFFENKAIKKKWKKENLAFDVSMFEKKDDNEHFGLYLLMKATQYYLLYEASIHLHDFFETNEFDSKKLKKFKREDISRVLLQNEFLELFSKPINLRPKFVDEDIDEEEEKEISSLFSGKLIFEKFELTLPLNSEITIQNENTLVIKTPRFRVEFQVIFGSMGHTSHERLLEYFFGYEKTEKLLSYDIEIIINAKFNTFGLITKSDWAYYEWIDSLIHELEESISIKSFYKQINWNTVDSIIKVEEMKYD